MRVAESDIEALELMLGLDKKVHAVKTYAGDNGSQPVERDEYDVVQSLRPEELTAVLVTVMHNPNLVLRPINTNKGFSVGFSVDYIEPNATKRLVYGKEDAQPVLRFLEEQLPQEHSFNTLASYFMHDINLRKIVRAGLEMPKRDRTHYDY